MVYILSFGLVCTEVIKICIYFYMKHAYLYPVYFNASHSNIKFCKKKHLVLLSCILNSFFTKSQVVHAAVSKSLYFE